MRNQPLDDAQAQAELDDSREIRRLYQDPKTYLHNMELLAHLKGVDRGFGQADMMTVGGNRYIFTGRMVVDVTNAKEPAITNASAPYGELAYNQALKLEDMVYLDEGAKSLHGFPRKPTRPLMCSRTSKATSRAALSKSFALLDA